MAKRGALKIGESRNNITRLGETRYRVNMRDGKNPDGTPKRVYVYLHGTEADAAAVRDQLVADRLGGKSIGTDKQPLADYLETWLRDKAKGNRPGMKLGKVTPRTLERYASLLRGGIVPMLGNIPIGQLTAEHLTALYHRWETEPRSNFEPQTGGKRSHKAKGAERSSRSDKPYSPTTIHHRHVALKMALDDAVKFYRLIPTNPADDARAPRPRPPMPERGEDADMHVLDEGQLAHLLDTAAGTDIGFLVYLAAQTGARLGELLALRVTDFDADRDTLRIERSLSEVRRSASDSAWYEIKSPKSARSRRTVKLGPLTAKHLADEIAARNRSAAIARMDRLLFVSQFGEPLRPSAVSARFRALAESCGYSGLRFHDLRHTHASLSLKRGDSPHVVSARLGHAEVGTTLRLYSHNMPGQDADLANGFEAMIESKRAAGSAV